MRRVSTALLAALTAVAGLSAVPAEAHTLRHGRPTAPAGCTGTAPVVCHFDVAPGTYDVTALLGGAPYGAPYRPPPASAVLGAPAVA